MVFVNSTKKAGEVGVVCINSMLEVSIRRPSTHVVEYHEPQALPPFIGRLAFLP
jgi:hypothetical protein